MKPKALFIGSIGAVAETSELQRQAYNQAMKEEGLSWNWDISTYKELLQTNGGKDRLQLLAKATDTHLSEEKIKNIHKRKTEIAGKLIQEHNIKPRTGITELIKQARKNDIKVAWVTTTYPENTNSILNAFDGALTTSDFDHIFHRTDVKNGKPSPEIYEKALNHFDLKPSECVAIEDSLISIFAAKGSGLFSIATLGAYHDEHVKNIADMVTEDLSKIDWSDISKAFENY